MDEWVDEETGDRYVSSDFLSHGDYAGAGDIGRANIRVLEDNPDSILRHGGYGYEQLWLPDTPENRELIEGLESDYPLLDDEVHSQIESELEDEAWENWLRRDLVRETPETIRDFAEDVDNDILYECYRQAMEKENEYPIFEGDGAYVRIEEIQDTFNELLIPHLPEPGKAIGLLEQAGFDTDDEESMYIAQDWLHDRGYSEEIIKQAMEHLGFKDFNVYDDESPELQVGDKASSTSGNVGTIIEVHNQGGRRMVTIRWINGDESLYPEEMLKLVTTKSMKHIKSLRLKYMKSAPDQSNREGFLAALRENPNDWQTREIYADFLEESGDSEGAKVERKLSGMIQKGRMVKKRFTNREERRVKYEYMTFAESGDYEEVNLLEADVGVLYEDNYDHAISFYECFDINGRHEDGGPWLVDDDTVPYVPRSELIKE